MMSHTGLIPNAVQNKEGPIVDEARKQEIKRRFLEVMGQTNIKQAAIQASGASQATIYAWIKNGYISQDDLDAALLVWHDTLRGEIYKRAYQGTKKLALSNGRIVRDEKGEAVYQMIPDSNLLVKIAEHTLPEWQGAKKVEVTNVTPSGIPQAYLITIDARLLTPSELQTIKKIAERIQERESGVVIVDADEPEK